MLNAFNPFFKYDGYWIYSDYFKIRLYLSDMTTRPIINNENIQIYGSNVITIRDSLYFTNVQNYQHHSYILQELV